MRDLEIRGAGNLLGETSRGHIAAVGYDLYCQMVTEAVAELKGEEVREPAEVKLDLPARRPPPAGLRGKEELRLEAYRRLAAVTTEAEVDDIRAEWVDRYGPLPAPAEALLAVGRLRAECHRLGVREVDRSVAGMARLSPLELKTSEAGAPPAPGSRRRSTRRTQEPAPGARSQPATSRPRRGVPARADLPETRPDGPA